MRIGEALSSATRARFLGLTLDDYIHYFFRGNAVIAILILLLIMTFLFKEGAEYLPDYNRSYEIYRKSGMEMVTVAREQMDHHQKLLQFLQQVENESEARLSEATLTSLRAQATQLREMIEPNREIIDRWTELTTRVRNTEINNQNLNDAIELWEEKGDMEFVAQLRTELKPVEYSQVQQQLRSEVPLYRNANDSINRQLSQILSQPVSLPAAAQGGYDAFTKSVSQYRDRLPSYIEEMEAWDPEQPVKWTRSLTGFLMGKRWVTNSFWQDVYGVVPLLTGSLMISTLALIVAVPLALASAIYANQIARPFELNLIKPYIEFITAIPSIVLGFFGIVVLGSYLQQVSNGYLVSPETIESLPGIIGWIPQILNSITGFITQWIPGFPMSERLNITTAGLLLALMAVPTIFTLVEDALNNVPRQYVEASYALGATRLQTILKIMIPAALSGIIAAILLGLGRVIGETMVVLLCAGNRLAIPDFTQGIGAFFEPAHTMTGIIAQEMGEVPPGSVHYRALFHGRDCALCDFAGY
jgi:phosphate transport system permease protein